MLNKDKNIINDILNELSNNEKDALLDYALKKITEKEYVQSYKEEKQNEK